MKAITEVKLINKLQKKIRCQVIQQVVCCSVVLLTCTDAFNSCQTWTVLHCVKVWQWLNQPSLMDFNRNPN